MKHRPSYNTPKDKKDENFHEGRNCNPFVPLCDYNIECYKCNNFGHKGHDCRGLLKSHLKENVATIYEEKPNEG